MAGYMTDSLIAVRQGDSFDIVLQLRNSDGKPLNIQDWTITMKVYDKEQQKMVLVKEGDIFETSQGKARIDLKPEDTSLAVGDYVTNIEVVTDQEDVHTVFPQDINRLGIFRVTEQITE